MKKLLGFLFTLVLVLSVHEVGHYTALKVFGAGVNKFKIGIGPEIAGCEIGETRFELGIVPLAAYVESASSDFSKEEIAEIGKKNPARARMLRDPTRHFNSLDPAQQLVVLLAGPVANVLFTLCVVLAFLRLFGLKDERLVGAIVSSVSENGKGLRKGDLITKVDGKALVDFNQLGQSLSETMERLAESLAKAQDVEVVRDGEALQLRGGLGEQGAEIQIRSEKRSRHRFSLLKALRQAPYLTWLEIVYSTRVVLRYFVPNTWGKITSLELKKLPRKLPSGVSFVCRISILLGVANLAPVPPLDGGQLCFPLWEVIGGEVSETLLSTICGVGIWVLLFLFLARPLLLTPLYGLATAALARNASN